MSWTEKLTETIPNASHFTWKELLYLPSFNLYAFPSTKVKDNLIDLMWRVENIRTHLGVPLKVTSGYRPEYYNKHIGGSSRSHHIQGKAIDLIPVGMSVAEAQELIVPKLVEAGLRMEQVSGWIHLDTGEVKFERYFRP